MINIGSYLLANTILGVPAVIAAVMISKKQKATAPCDTCKHLERKEKDKFGYKYKCAWRGKTFNKQPEYCSHWAQRKE